MVTPEILTALRGFLIALGGWAVGYFHLNEDVIMSFVGLLLVLAPIGWSMWGKRPSSGEAIQIAERVAESDAPQARHIVADESRREVSL